MSSNVDRTRNLWDLEAFFVMSAQLNWMLTSEATQDCLPVITNGEELSDHDREVMARMLEYLEKAYNGRRRLLGTLAVLHPLRAAALLVRARGRTNLLDLMTELLHDKREDLEDTTELDALFQGLLQQIDPTDAWFLNERIEWLTRKNTESYQYYISRVLEQSTRTPELLRAKLADQLDNILDMRIGVVDPLPVGSFHEIVFDILFRKDYKGFKPTGTHSTPKKMDGAQRLYRLHKAATILTTIRSQCTPLDETSARLFEAIAHAGICEAERILLHLWGFHVTDVETQRRLLLSTMQYSQAGGLDIVTEPSSNHPLDGLFSRFFAAADKKTRESQLCSLYDDKALMMQAAVAFVIIFDRFVDEPGFCLADF